MDRRSVHPRTAKVSVKRLVADKKDITRKDLIGSYVQQRQQIYLEFIHCLMYSDVFRAGKSQNCI